MNKVSNKDLKKNVFNYIDVKYRNGKLYFFPKEGFKLNKVQQAYVKLYIIENYARGCYIDSVVYLESDQSYLVSIFDSEIEIDEDIIKIIVGS